MFDFVAQLFDGSDFPARWHCGRWTDFHGWVHIASDLAIFGAYLMIPLVLAYFVRKHPHAPFPRIFWLFCAFIVACGFTHLNEAIIFWHPMYRFAGAVKVVTAAVSWATVLALLPVVPQALALRTPADLEAEVARRTAELDAAEKRVEQALQHLDIAMEDLQSAEARIRLIVEAAPNAMLMVDPDRRISFMNTRTETLFGYSRDELMGRPVEVLVPKSMRAAHPANVKSFLDDPVARPMGGSRDLFGVRKDGTEVPIEIGLTPVETPEGMRVLASIIDITERKQAEIERERLITDLQRSNEELAQFAYVASHDLQEPLRTVVSFTELLAKRYEGQLDERADKYIRYVTEGGTRMSELLTDLLAYSRVGTHGKPLEAVDSGPAVRDALQNLRAQVAATGGKCTVVGELPRVMADSVQLTQLVQNLVSNALKFHRRDVPPDVAISAVRDADVWVFAVRDNGIGIDADYFEVILRPFQRLHQRGEYQGSGIGLAIAKKIVERHGGRLWLESIPGEGTTFYFSCRGAPDGA